MTGAGLSVERKYVSKLPKVSNSAMLIHETYNPVEKQIRNEFTELRTMGNNTAQIIVGDSKFGWSEAIRFYFELKTKKQYADIKYICINYNSVRPEGERLKTFGGFASGHTNLLKMFEKIENVIKNRATTTGNSWFNLTSLDCLDIATTIAENVVSGGKQIKDFRKLCL